MIAAASHYFDIAERNREIAWDLRYLGNIGRCWKLLLSQTNLPLKGSCISLCSGSRPKAELGLLYHGFSGKLTCINKDARELEELAEFLKLFNAGFRTEPLCADIFAVERRSANLILGNHIIDDLCYDSFSSCLGIEACELYQDPKLVQRFWQLVPKAQLIAEISEKLAGIIMRLSRPGGCCILTQYQSQFEEVYELNKCTDICREIMLAAAQELSNQGFMQRRVPSHVEWPRDSIIGECDYVVLCRTVSQGNYQLF